MAVRPNLWGPGLVKPDGALSKPLMDYLENIAATTTDATLSASITALTQRIQALENDDLSIVGDGTAITVFGTAESGYEIRFTGGSATDPLVAQIFGS